MITIGTIIIPIYAQLMPVEERIEILKQGLQGQIERGLIKHPEKLEGLTGQAWLDEYGRQLDEREGELLSSMPEDMRQKEIENQKKLEGLTGDEWVKEFERQNEEADKQFESDWLEAMK
jgi:hypothetical protein